MLTSRTGWAAATRSLENRDGTDGMRNKLQMRDGESNRLERVVLKVRRRKQAECVSFGVWTSPEMWCSISATASASFRAEGSAAQP